VIIPFENQRDLKEIPDNIKAALEIRPVKWIDEVLQIALEHMPEALSDEEYDRPVSATGVVEGDANPRISAH